MKELIDLMFMAAFPVIVIGWLFVGLVWLKAMF